MKMYEAPRSLHGARHYSFSGFIRNHDQHQVQKSRARRVKVFSCGVRAVSPRAATKHQTELYWRSEKEVNEREDVDRLRLNAIWFSLSVVFQNVS
jgi:hypothetical protein